MVLWPGTRVVPALQPRHPAPLVCGGEVIVGQNRSLGTPSRVRKYEARGVAAFNSSYLECVGVCVARFASEDGYWNVRAGLLPVRENCIVPLLRGQATSTHDTHGKSLTDWGYSAILFSALTAWCSD